MPKPDPDQPPANACPLGQALRRFAPELAAALDEAEAAYAAKKANPSQARDRCAGGGWARLRAGTWTAWGREGSPTGPWRRLPPEAWAVLRPPLDRSGRPRRDGVWLECVQVKGSDLCYYGIVVEVPTAARRRPSMATLRAALLEAQAKKGEPLTQQEAEAIGLGLGASRDEARKMHDANSPRRRRAPRAAKMDAKPRK